MLIANLLVLLSASVFTGWLLDQGWRSLPMVVAMTVLGAGSSFGLCALLTSAQHHLVGVGGMMAVMCAITGVLNGNYPNTGKQLGAVTAQYNIA